MLKEVKKIIIQELEEYKRKREELIVEHEKLLKRKEEIDSEISLFSFESNKLLNKVIPSNKKRIKEEILKRQKEISNIEIQLTELSNKMSFIHEEAKSKYLSLLNFVSNEKYSNDFFNWDTLSEKIELIRQCQSLKQSGLKFYDAVELLQKKEFRLS